MIPWCLGVTPGAGQAVAVASDGVLGSLWMLLEMVRRCWSAAVVYLHVSMMLHDDFFQYPDENKPMGQVLPCCISKSVLLTLDNSILRAALSWGEAQHPSLCGMRRHLCRGGRPLAVRGRGSVCNLGSCSEALDALSLFLSRGAIYLLLPSLHAQLPLLFFVLISPCCLSLVVKSREQEDRDCCLHLPEQQH